MTREPSRIEGPEPSPSEPRLNTRQQQLIRKAQLQVVIDRARPNPMKLNHREYLAYVRACDEIRCLDEAMKKGPA